MNRRQASLFLPDQFQIESLRLRYNPVQARLIPAHVTLCREDEVADWDAVLARLESLCPFEIVLEFGVPVREDNFVYLPVREGYDEFHEFRCAILTKDARKQVPHVTIIHPRNGICTDQVFADIMATVSSFRYTFREVMLIEQEGDGIWKTITRVGQKSLQSHCSCGTLRGQHPNISPPQVG
jgi:2'-5' RNA ligase